MKCECGAPDDQGCRKNCPSLKPNRNQRVLEALNVTARHATEVSVEFMRGMASRMCMSFEKYGAVADFKADALACALARIEKYHTTKNTEYLMDAANFCMIEFMKPRYRNAFFEPTDSDGSIGRVHADGRVDQSSNTHEQELKRTGFRYNRDGD